MNYDAIIFYSSQGLILIVVALWIIGGKRMRGRPKKKKTDKQRIPSEILDDDNEEDYEPEMTEMEQQTTTPRPPGLTRSAPKPAPEPELSEEQSLFVDWLNDWQQRFQYMGDATALANTGEPTLRYQEMLLLTGLAHNSDLVLDELRRQSKLLRELLRTQRDEDDN